MDEEIGLGCVTWWVSGPSILGRESGPSTWCRAHQPLLELHWPEGDLPRLYPKGWATAHVDWLSVINRYRSQMNDPAICREAERAMFREIEEKTGRKADYAIVLYEDAQGTVRFGMAVDATTPFWW